MLKKLIAIFLLMVLTFSLVSCKSKQDDLPHEGDLEVILTETEQKFVPQGVTALSAVNGTLKLSATTSFDTIVTDYEKIITDLAIEGEVTTPEIKDSSLAVSNWSYEGKYDKNIVTIQILASGEQVSIVVVLTGS